MSVQITDYNCVVERLPADSTVILREISWEEYEALLERVDESAGLRISYDQGTLVIMRLSAKHEMYARLIEKMIGLLSVKLRIRVLSFGSATMRKRAAEKGSEPDACFYVGSADRIRGKEEVDSSSDPPDIVVEIDVHHDSLSKLATYAALGVPEIWRYDGQNLIVYQLDGGQYVVVSASGGLPMLTSAVLTSFLNRSQPEDQYDTLLAFEEWLDNLQP